MEKVRKNEYLSLNPYLEDISFVTKIQAIIPQYDSYFFEKEDLCSTNQKVWSLCVRQFERSRVCLMMK